MDVIMKSQCNEGVMIGEMEETKAKKIEKWSWKKDIKSFL